ncbi:MAG: cob(I)yrinic acid a,c-diamide adenosyltransferase [Nitrosomonadales bacterium]|nr:cob(I)yrinic acid a,c-diamide adenosyltransferase [Nitrosomonadales bacterium]
MVDRLTHIVTRTGDDGTTGLADGSRVSKTSARIAAIGSVDELNSLLGLLLCEPLPERVRTDLLPTQHELFELGGALAYPEHGVFPPAAVARLDALAVGYNAALPPLKEFILPGGTRPAALAHVARATTRRAERDVAALAQQELIATSLLPYLNRLSDWLFVLARTINREAGHAETGWVRGCAISD